MTSPATAPAQRRWSVRQSSPRLDRPTYLVDGECGFCLQAMTRVHRVFPGSIVSIPFQAFPVEEFGLTVDDCRSQGHMLTPVGDAVRIASGSQSWAAVLLLQPQPWRLLGAAMQRQPVKVLADAAYRLVAANRRRLGWIWREHERAPD